MLLADPQFGIAAFLKHKWENSTEPPGPNQTVAPDGVPGEGWPFEQAQLTRAIEIANEINPDFVMVLGDMVMHWNDKSQVADLRATFKKLSPSIPLYWVPGNHDVGVDFLTPSDESIAAYRENYGSDWHAFTVGPCRFIALNSPLFDKPLGAQTEHDAQLRWLESELSQPLPSGVAHRIVFAHHPLFLQDSAEPYGIYNLPESERSRLIDLFSRHGIEYMFTGHTHFNNLSRHGNLRVIATSAVGVTKPGSPAGYRLVNADADSISHSFHALA